MNGPPLTGALTGRPIDLSLQLPSRAPDAAPVVSVRGLSRTFGENQILKSLDLDLAPGEFVALLGRSGSGKTTLLRTLAGLDPVTEGEVRTPDRKAVVFQEARLLPWRRIVDNVTLGLREGDAARRATVALEEVGLGHRLQAWPHTLSGGEAQRAALARALVREPELLLLDEPFASLDALTRLRMQALVQGLWRKHGCAVLMVSHDVDEALLLADRVVVLEAGRIVASEDVRDARPRSTEHPTFQRLRRRLLGLLGVDLPALVEDAPETDRRIYGAAR
jgi:sulfonate transport system ATP-binding protein